MSTCNRLDLQTLISTGYAQKSLRSLAPTPAQIQIVLIQIPVFGMIVPEYFELV